MCFLKDNFLGPPGNLSPPPPLPRPLLSLRVQAGVGWGHSGAKRHFPASESCRLRNPGCSGCSLYGQRGVPPSAQELPPLQCPGEGERKEMEMW